MSVHSVQLYAANGLPAGARDVYTVPAGKRTIWKNIVVFSSAAAAQRVVFSVKRAGSTIAFYTVYCAAASSVGDTQDKATWIVLNAGDVINVSNPANNVAVILSGAELDV